MDDKSVLISIQPKWCELIASGKKTVEVRKTKPAIKTPFKCYIYCTLQGCNELFKDTLNESIAKWNEEKWGTKKGSVIGEFICNLIAPIAYTTDGFADIVDCETTCMTPQDFLNYGKGDVLYGWRISDLKIYDKPRELSEFANSSSRLRFSDTKDGFPLQWSGLQKPPQSWCYVKEVQNNVKP